MTFEFTAIGVAKTDFKEKFGVPRQSGLVPSGKSVIQLFSDTRFSLAVQHLDRFTHLWVLFVFHKDLEKPWDPLVMPPRVEKPNRVGVFASRSPHRPNPIGMSVGKIEKVDSSKKSGIEIHLSGMDLLDGTPILDIKPYLPYADSIPEASSGWADKEIETYSVEYSSDVLKKIQALSEAHQPDLKKLLDEVISLDPRPTTQRRRAPMGTEKAEGKVFGFRFLGFHIRCEIRSGGFFVSELEELK